MRHLLPLLIVSASLAAVEYEAVASGASYHWHRKGQNEINPGNRRRVGSRRACTGIHGAGAAVSATLLSIARLAPGRAEYCREYDEDGGVTVEYADGSWKYTPLIERLFRSDP